MASETSQSPAYTLPEEIWIEIFRYLRSIDILRVRLVCKQWAFMSISLAIRKKLRLRLDDPSSVSELQSYIAERTTSYLPEHSVNLVNLKNNKSLEFILTEFAPHLHDLKLKNSIVFETLAAANIINIERLELKFDEASPEYFDGLQLHFIRNYRNLKSFNFIFPNELIHFGMNVLHELLEADQINSLKHLHLTYHFDENQTFWKILEKYAGTLEELEVYFESPLNTFSSRNWYEKLAKLKNLKTLRISGDCKLDVTMKFFENLPANAPLSLIELDGITSLTDEILKLTTDKWMHTIKHLSIFFSGNITKKGALEIWKLRKNLRSLRIGFCRTLGMKEFLSAIAKDKNYTLRQLCAYSMGCVDEHYLCNLAENLPRLETLDLSDNTQGLTNRVLAYIFRFQTSLRELILDNCCGFDDNGVAGKGAPEWNQTCAINRLHDLEVLSFQNCKGLRGSFVDNLMLPKLHTLKLCRLRYMTAGEFYKIVDNCPGLEVLYATNCDGMDDNVLYYICNNLKLLLELNIKHCAGLSDYAIDYAVQKRRIKYLAFTKN